MDKELKNFKKRLSDASKSFYQEHGYNATEIHLGESEKLYLTNANSPVGENSPISEREPDFCYGYLVIWEDEESCLYFE